MVHPSKIKITREELHDIMQEHHGKEAKSEAALLYVLSKLNNDVSEEEVPAALKKVFLYPYFKRWDRGGTRNSLDKFGKWLKEDVVLPDECFPNLKKNGKVQKVKKGENVEAPKLKGPRKALLDCCAKSQQRRTASIRENNSLEELVIATTAKLREAGDRTTAALLHECRSTTPTRAKRIMHKWKKEEKKPTKVTLEEAWALIKKRKLSKRTYYDIRKLALTHGHNVYPPYSAVTERQKMERAGKETNADYQEVVNDFNESEEFQDSAVWSERGVDDKLDYKKGDVPQKVGLLANATKVELMNASFTSIEVDSQVIQFPVISSAKMEYTGMQVPATQSCLTNWEINSLPTTSANYSCNGSEFFH